MQIELRVNGTSETVDVEPRRLLADVLRQDLRLHGCHLGCEHGVCGACTVLLDGRPVRACLMLAVQAEDHEIMTIEGIGTLEALHPVQRAFIAAHGLQCGFCTPGFILATIDLLDRHPNPSDELIREELAGNVCRCTGYENILAAVRLASQSVIAEPHQ